MFGNFNTRDAQKPFYTIDIDNEEEVLKWLNLQHAFRGSNGEELQRIDAQTTSLALYQNHMPESKRIFSGTSSGDISVFEKKTMLPIVEPMVGGIVDSWVARLGARKPAYNVFPKDGDDPSEKPKARTIKEILTFQAQKNNHTQISSMALQHMFIFGEAYIEVFWDEDVGPLDPIVQKDLNKRGEGAREDLGELIDGIRIGDIGTKLHDPRNVIVQPANSYDDAEWVLLMEPISVEKLRHEYPEIEDLIQPNNNLQMFTSFSSDLAAGENQTILFKFYHRAMKYMPEGQCILATPDVIIQTGPLSCPRYVKNQRLPVLQLTDTDIWGKSRGYAGTIMESIKTAQIAQNKLWLAALMNIATFSPKLTAQVGSLDASHLRVGDRNILYYRRGFQEPKLLVQEMVSQGHMLLIDKLRSRILALSNVEPTTEGVPRPNVESRDMLDFFKEQELFKSQPKDLKYKRFLEDWARLIVDMVADKYKDEDERSIQYFGDLKSRVQKKLEVKDLDTEVDVHVETSAMAAQSLQGRIQEIQDILTLAPNAFTPGEIIERLEIGSPEKLYDSATAATTSAEKDIFDILSGKDVSSPNRYQDILTHYDVYMKELQKDRIRALLPEIHSPGAGDIGNNILDQVSAIEKLIVDILKEKGDIPVYIPNAGAQGLTYRQIVYGRFPTFPAVFKPDALEFIDPFEIKEEAIIPQNPNPTAGSPINPQP